MKINIKKLIILAALVALNVVFTRLLAVNAAVFKLGVGFAAVAVCAMLYGPGWAALCAALGDLIGALLFPTGAYFPGFTLSAALSGLIFGLLLYKKRPDIKRCFLAALLDGAIVTLLLNTLMISTVFGPKFMPLLYTRLAQFGAMLVIETALLAALSRSDAMWAKIIEIRQKSLTTHNFNDTLVERSKDSRSL